MTYEDVALWVLEQQRNTLLDDESTMKMLSQSWKNEGFKKKLLMNPKTILEEQIGFSIPTDIAFKLVHENSKTIYIVVPLKLDNFNPLNKNLSENLVYLIGSGGNGIVVSSGCCASGTCS
jgi:hypothetical protein